MTLLVDNLAVSVDVGGDLGLQRRGQHLPGAVTEQLVQQQSADPPRGCSCWARTIPELP
jgi:hypothetical protein